MANISDPTAELVLNEKSNITSAWAWPIPSHYKIRANFGFFPN